jgi:hypothetical protein
MSARYLIRLDDACDTMRRDNWSRVEEVLQAHGVQPIAAVIPDNRDPSLQLEPPDRGFWDKVAGWVRKGWSVALHGHTHLMRPTDARLVLPFYSRSEFGGLPLSLQCEKIRAAWSIFGAHGVDPRIWVAPAHSFDLDTLRAVHLETPIRLISDGIACDTFRAHGFDWIPQQLWSFAERPFGLWTVCLHPNTMRAADIDALDRSLGGRYRGRVVGVADLPMRARRRSVRDRLFEIYFWRRWRRAARRRQ